MKDSKPLEMPKATYRSVENSTNLTDSPDAVQTIMIIPVMDVIVKNNYPEYGLLGLRGMQSMLKEAISNDSILGVMFYGDCPGGTTSDLAETVDMVAELVQKKPVAAYADGMMCSAFTYLTAPCSFIACTPKTSIIGNIGSVSTVTDDSGMLEQYGIKVIEVYGDLATDKDLGYAELIAGKPEKFKNMIVNPHNEMFVADMKKYRPQIKDEALHGAVYLSEKAKEMGLVDMCCGFDEALNHLIGMTKISTDNNNTNDTMQKKITIVANTIMVAGLHKLYPDAIIEDITEEGQPDNPPAEPQTPPANPIPETDDTLQLLVQTIADLKAELAQRNKPGASAVLPVVTGVEAVIETNDNTGKVEDKLEDLPHIKAAMEALN